MNRRLVVLVRRLGRSDDRGSVAPMAILGTLVVLILGGLVLDQGLAMADRVRLLDVAQGAARSGAQAVDLAIYRSTGQVRLNPALAAANARRFLAQAGVTGSATASATAVTVSVSGVRRTELLHLVGVTGIPVAATATATAATGN
jgi:hypothetical protein